MSSIFLYPLNVNPFLAFLLEKKIWLIKNYHIISLNDILIEEIGHENENDIDFLMKEVLGKSFCNFQKENGWVGQVQYCFPLKSNWNFNKSYSE